MIIKDYPEQINSLPEARAAILLTICSLLANTDFQDKGPLLAATGYLNDNLEVFEGDEGGIYARAKGTDLISPIWLKSSSYETEYKSSRIIEAAAILLFTHAGLHSVIVKELMNKAIEQTS
ncbi:hypothetical protein K4M64_004534 [Salmonella enterica]|nr:hypothetical protein [Salmonella enterica]